MKTRGQFSKPTPFNYQSHQSLQKFRKVPIQQRADEIVQDIFKVKIKGQQNSKFVAARNSAPSKQDQVKELKKYIRSLELQLKKKILQNPLLSRIFKTKVPSNGQLSHLDLYMQFLNLKEDQQNSQKKVQEAIQVYKKKQIAYELEISQLKQQKEQRQQSFIEEIEKATQKFEILQNEFKRKILQKEKLFEKQTIERQTKIQDQNLIMEELKRKNHKLTKDNKQLEGRFNEYKKSEQQRIKSLKIQFESYKQKVDEQKNNKNQQIQKERLNLDSVQQKLQNKISNLQNELAEKTLQIQELDRFIELEKQSFQNQMNQIQTSYKKKLQQQKDLHQDNMLLLQQKNQSIVNKMKRQHQQKIKQVSTKYQNQIKRLKQQLKQQNIQINKLQSQIQQKTNYIQRIEQQLGKYKIQIQGQIQNLKLTNKQISQDKEALLKRLTQSQIKVQKLQKQIHYLTHQKNQIHSKYQKGYINTEHDIKHYQTVIEELERKIYMLGNQNMGLRRSNQEKNDCQNKVKQLKRVNQETLQQKYKSIGRIEQIRHKLESYLMNDIVKSCFSSTLLNSTNNYRSNTNMNVSITQTLQGLTLVLDRLCEGYSGLNQWVESYRKLKAQDERQIESILNHFLDMEERQQDLQDGMINYINVRKELNKQLTTGPLSTGEEYLHENKRQLSHFLIQKLIQLKVIKQYSSADQSNPNMHNYNYNSRLIQQQQQQNSLFASNNNSSKNLSNPRNSTKSVTKFLLEQNYTSNPNQTHSNQYDSLQSYSRQNNLRKSIDSDKRMSLYKTKQLSKTKNFQSTTKRNSNRLSTEPTKSQLDIQQQSTYEIIDENIDYTNLRKRQNSKFKLTQQYNSGGSQSNIEKQQLNKKYKQQIKEKLLQGKTKRQSNFGLSKEDIEKKYFMR